jgi:hypothetical protein
VSEDHLRAAGPSQANAIAVRERALGDLVAVDVGPIARISIAQQEAVVLDEDFGVIARDFAAGQPEVVGLAAANLEVTLGNRHDPPTHGVGYFESGI